MYKNTGNFSGEQGSFKKKKTLRQKKFYFGALVFYQFSRVETDHLKKNYFMLVKRLFIHLFQFFNKFLKAINPFIPTD